MVKIKIQPKITKNISKCIGLSKLSVFLYEILFVNSHLLYVNRHVLLNIINKTQICLIGSKSPPIDIGINNSIPY